MIATNSPSRKKGEKFECSKECSLIFLKNKYAKLDNGKEDKEEKTDETKA